MVSGEDGLAQVGSDAERAGVEAALLDEIVIGKDIGVCALSIVLFLVARHPRLSACLLAKTRPTLVAHLRRPKQGHALWHVEWRIMRHATGGRRRSCLFAVDFGLRAFWHSFCCLIEFG